MISKLPSTKEEFSAVFEGHWRDLEMYLETAGEAQCQMQARKIQSYLASVHDIHPEFLNGLNVTGFIYKRSSGK